MTNEPAMPPVDAKPAETQAPSGEFPGDDPIKRFVTLTCTQAISGSTMWPDFSSRGESPRFRCGSASLLFNGIRFSSTSALIISTLLLGFANAVLRPLLVILTLPLTLLSLGLFLLVINALILLLVARLVDGFKLSGFWTAFFPRLFSALLGMALGALAPNAETTIDRLPQRSVKTIAL